eukprot:4938113-Prymnesium_polylepis.1
MQMYGCVHACRKGYVCGLEAAGCGAVAEASGRTAIELRWQHREGADVARASCVRAACDLYAS